MGEVIRFPDELGSRGGKYVDANTEPATRALLRKPMTINANRGRLIALPGTLMALITVHPSYLLRLREERDKRREFDRLVKDLQLADEATRQARP
jgi:DNA polymerase